jgi:hypothetical protein
MHVRPFAMEIPDLCSEDESVRTAITRPRRLARPRTPPFHGDNTGSNPVGDANKPLSHVPVLGDHEQAFPLPDDSHFRPSSRFSSASRVCSRNSPCTPPAAIRPWSISTDQGKSAKLHNLKIYPSRVPARSYRFGETSGVNAAMQVFNDTYGTPPTDKPQRSEGALLPLRCVLEQPPTR